MTDTEPLDLPLNTLWRHKRLPKIKRLYLTGRSGDEELVRVIDEGKQTIQWMTRKGFLRDYELISEEVDA